MIYETQKDLEEGLAKWQKILRLQDWDIAVKLLRKSAMVHQDRNADVTMFRSHKATEVHICEAEDMQNANTDCWPVDQERWLVHELLHVAIESFTDAIEDGTETHIMMERFVDSHARVLVAMDRRST